MRRLVSHFRSWRGCSHAWRSPQGLKPSFICSVDGAAKAAPFQNRAKPATHLLFAGVLFALVMVGSAARAQVIDDGASDPVLPPVPQKRADQSKQGDGARNQSRTD